MSHPSDADPSQYRSDKGQSRQQFTQEGFQNPVNATAHIQRTGESRGRPSGSTPNYDINWSYTADSSSSSSAPQTAAPNQKHPGTRASQPHQESAMIGPPPMFYDPDHVDPQNAPSAGSYQHWVDTYQDPQYNYGTDNQPTVSHISYSTTMHSQIPTAPMGELTTAVIPPQAQDQYGYVQGQYIPHAMESQDNSYGQQFIQGHSGQQTRSQQGIGHPVGYAQPAHNLPQHQIQGGAMVHPGYQQSTAYMQQPQRQIQAQQQPPPQGTDVYYFQNPAVQQQPQPQPTFTFTHYAPPGDQFPASAASNFTPSPDMGNMQSSLSPSSFTGTEDSQSHPLPSASGQSPPSQQQQTSAPQTPQNQGASTSQRLNPSAGSGGKRERGTTRSSRGRGPAKRPRKLELAADSDTASDDEDAAPVSSTVPPLKGTDSTPARLPGACTHCKKLKMKCDFPPGENTCKRCKASGHPCIVEGRKPRNAPNKREYLLAQIRQKDAIIESLLKQLHNPYLATPLSIAAYRMATSPSDQNNRNVLAWLDRLQSSVQSAGTPGGAKAFGLESRQQGVQEESEDDSEDDPTTGRTVVPRDVEDLQAEDEKLHSLPDAAVPLGLIANLALSNTNSKKAASRDGEAEVEDDDNVGVANETYFMPGPAYDLGIRANLIEQNSPPDILVHKLVTPDDVDKLFEIFYARLNVHVTLLDPVLHTPSSTFSRCPFLFTVICAVASRYYADKSEIYPIAMHFAKHAAANALITGWKSVELAQAYILMSIYAVPARRWEDDRSWLYTGLATRIATDLNLHQPSTVKPTSELQEREILNRTRVWLICYNLDRSTATQYGKPSTIREDYIVRHSTDWYKKSQYNETYDLGLCAYTALLRVVAKFHEEIFSDPDTPSGLNQRLDFLEVTSRHDEHLTRFFEEWSRRFREDTDTSDPGAVFRSTLLPFLTSYSRLVMYSFGFQGAFRRGMQNSDHIFLEKCFDSAKSVIKCMIEVLAPSGYMRYSPDGHFIFATFASAFLLKLLKPEFSSLLTKAQQDDIFELIARLIHTLNSPEIAIDDRHTPRLHARFLAGLLSKHRRGVSSSSRNTSQNPPQNQERAGSGGTYSSQSPPSSTSNVFQATPPPSNDTQGQGMGPSQGPSDNMMTEPIYPADPTYSGGTAPFEMFNFGATPNGGMEDDLVGALQVLKNPAYWQNMMMPGFHWPENRMVDNTYHQAVPGLNPNINHLPTAGVQYS
ncbi:hypothetical protein C8Q75DRAFT_744153 [Abortiporus biennis]|nr:hypothetical protein C8Q75DRAFT_744153 [Abortiporus biennis]